MLVSALIMASGEAVMALGTGSYASLATSEVWALLWGQSPGLFQSTLNESTWHFIGTLLLEMPAWAVFGPSGVILAHICRKRPPKGRLFRTR